MVLRQTFQVFGEMILFFFNPQIDSKDSTLFTHELTHDVFPARFNNEKVDFDQEMPKWMTDLITNAVEQSREDDGPLGFEMAKTIESCRKPHEVYARIEVLREKYGFSPIQIITEANLEIIYKKNFDAEIRTVENHNVNQLLYIIKKDLLISLLNKLP